MGSALPRFRPSILDPGGPSPLVVVTVGNDLRGDDGVGPYVAKRLAGDCRDGVEVIDAGERPENVLEQVVALKPARMVVLDAADFGGVPGELRVISHDAVGQTTVSTHLFPLAAIAALIEKDTGAAVTFLGVQVVDVRLGAPLAPAVRETADAIVAWLAGGQ